MGTSLCRTILKSRTRASKGILMAWNQSQLGMGLMGKLACTHQETGISLKLPILMLDQNRVQLIRAYLDTAAQVVDHKVGG